MQNVQQHPEDVTLKLRNAAILFKGVFLPEMTFLYTVDLLTSMLVEGQEKQFLVYP